MIAFRVGSKKEHPKTLWNSLFSLCTVIKSVKVVYKCCGIVFRRDSNPFSNVFNYKSMLWLFQYYCSFKFYLIHILILTRKSYSAWGTRSSVCYKHKYHIVIRGEVNSLQPSAFCIFTTWQTQISLFNSIRPRINSNKYLDCASQRDKYLYKCVLMVLTIAIKVLTGNALTKLRFEPVTAKCNAFFHHWWPLHANINPVNQVVVEIVLLLPSYR
jgi:hypothetical protein